jgi:signal transduction histidine kinase
VAAEQVEARERLEQVDRARDRLIANVSHELRTPLTSTIGSIETLLREDVRLDDASRDRLMHVARDGGLRLLALVEDLLTIGATRPDSLELDAAPEHLARLAEDAIVGIDPGADRAIRIDVRHDPWVRVDRLRMLQVVANLVMNGVRHGRGDVVVQVDDDHGQAVLRVLDDGDGVDPEHVGELFLPFARFSTRSDSTGLGLAICRTIVEAHGGSIRYARVDDARTCFSVELPMDGSTPLDR